ncbi:MAG: hypothetical protein COA95_09095 [Methylophaga sp.]|nr:MAG: hypothetical protein COA95_09095 [Methylophaga sp.]
MPTTHLILALMLFSLSSLSFASDHDIQLPLTKQSAAELIQLESHGKILSVEQSKTAEKTFFLIKVLYDNGEIRLHYLDASTGLPPKPTRD